MARTIIDIHVLQNVPPSNMNRDDTGTPKSAYYGGVRRARVSSQAWKRATRKQFERLLSPEELGVRTKKVAEALANRIIAHDASLAGNAPKLAKEVLEVATGSSLDVPKRKEKNDGDGTAVAESKYLMFLSRRQLDALAELAVSASGGGDIEVLKKSLKDKEQKARARNAVDTRHSIDIALFGRMVADSADLNVEAATQVAHALSVHRSDIESDYYTAVDDLNKESETGAGMIGTIDFNSATLYRYAAVDVDELQRNLGVGLKDGEPPSTPTAKAVAAFLEAFITSLPTGKINTFANHTPPSAVLVKIRDKWPLNFVGAFEEPVPKTEQGGFLRESCRRLAEYVPDVERQYGIGGGRSLGVPDRCRDTDTRRPRGGRDAEGVAGTRSHTPSRSGWGPARDNAAVVSRGTVAGVGIDLAVRPADHRERPHQKRCPGPAGRRRRPAPQRRPVRPDRTALRRPHRPTRLPHQGLPQGREPRHRPRHAAIRPLLPRRRGLRRRRRRRRDVRQAAPRQPSTHPVSSHF